MHIHCCDTCKYFVKREGTIWENDLCMYDKLKEMSRVRQFDIKLSSNGCKVWKKR
jgi:hypothetical protein